MITIKTVEAGRGAAWLTEGFAYFRRGIGVWIGISIIMLVFFLVLSLLPFIGGILMTLLTPVLVGGVVLGCRELDRGGSLSLNHLFAGFSRNTGQLILLGLLQYVATIVIMVIAAFIVMPFTGGMGSIMHFMHGMENGATGVPPAMFLGILLMMLISLALYVPVVMALWFAPALIILDDRTAIDALTDSFKGCLKNMMPFLIYGLVGLVLAIVASIPLMLGWLVLLPVLLASLYLGYKDIFENSEVETTNDEPAA